jgi:uncharacterized phage-associated protein
VNNLSQITSLDVAEYFLSKSILNTDWAITHLKLQKLVYYAQAWHVAIHNQPLFNEDIECWIHGTVCRRIYHKYRDYGFKEIPPVKNVDFHKFNKNQLSVLEAVWSAYGHLREKVLEAMVIQEEPWIKAWKTKKDNDFSSRIISIESMREFYSKLN